MTIEIDTTLVRDELNDLEHAIERKLQADMVREGARPWLKTVRRLVPKQSRRLLRSLHIDARQAQADVITDTDYAQPVEFGRDTPAGRVRGQHFMEDAGIDSEDEAADRAVATYADGVTRKLLREGWRIGL